MRFTRLAALAAIPVALSLAACAGDSTPAFTNATGQQANIRFVDGAPGLGAISIYYASTGSTPNSPLVNSLSYGQATDFIPEPLAASQVSVRGAGTASTTTPAVGPCNIPQLSNNAKYTIVIGGTGGTQSCYIYQDQDFTSALQYRFHQASPNAANVGTNVNFGYVTASGNNVPPPAPFTVQGAVALPASATAPTGATVAVANPNTIGLSAASPVTYAYGPLGPAIGAQEASVNTIGAQQALSPNSYSQPNAGGTATLPSGFAGISVFALDCTVATVTAIPGARCLAGTTLVDYLDTK